MKKLLLSLVCMLAYIFANATEFIPSSADAMTADGITVSFAKGSGSSAPAWTSNQLRLYANNTLTVSCSSQKIESITIAWAKQGNKTFATATADCGTYNHPTNNGNGTWEGSANEVVFTLGTSGQLVVNKITVVLANGQGGGNTDPEDPQDPEDPEDPQDPQPVSNTDVINYNSFSGISSSYKDFQITGASGAVYSGATQLSNNVINLTSGNKNCTNYTGIFVTTPATGKVVKSISINALTNASTSSRALKIFASNTAFSLTAAPTGDAVKEWSPVKGTPITDTYAFTDDYAYIAIVSPNGALNMASVTINWGEAGEDPNIPVTIAAPTFNPAAGKVVKGTEVAIACATEGASIFYTLDGTAPTNASTAYTAPIAINADTTIKAIAYKDGESSAVAEAAYTVYPEVESVAAAYSLEKGAQFVMAADLTVVYSASAYTYASDGVKTGLVYGYMPTGVDNPEAGTVMKAGWIGSIDVYNGLIELKPADMSAIVFEGTATVPAAEEVEAADLTAENQGMYVKLPAVSFASATPATGSFTGTMDGETVAFFNRFSVASQSAGTYDVEGFIAVFNTNIQVYPCSFSVCETAVAAPEFSVEEGVVEQNTEVAITCATAGATIYYTTDGTEPTAESDVYSAPIVISAIGNTTVKAFAAKAGLTPSAVVTAVYTVIDPNATTVEVPFNWADPTSIDAGIVLPAQSNGTAVNDQTFTVGNVSMSFNKGTAGTDCRIWNSKGNYDLRLYTGSSFTISVNNSNISPMAADGEATAYRIVNIDFKGTKTAAASVTPTAGQCENGSASNQVIWSADADSEITSVTFAVVASFQITTCDVTLEKISTGLDNIAIDSSVPVQFYNLQGVPMNGENLPAGLYIRRQGNTTTKVLVK